MIKKETVYDKKKTFERKTRKNIGNKMDDKTMEKDVWNVQMKRRQIICLR